MNFCGKPGFNVNDDGRLVGVNKSVKLGLFLPNGLEIYESYFLQVCQLFEILREAFSLQAWLSVSDLSCNLEFCHGC